MDGNAPAGVTGLPIGSLQVQGMGKSDISGESYSRGVEEEL